MSVRLKTVALLAGLALSFQATAQDQKPHNIILFVPDGLRALSVTPETAPMLARIRDQGVNFQNPHSLFPTFTMPNSAGMSTGHHLGDTGIYSNGIFTGYPVTPAKGSVTPFIENDAVLGDLDAHFAGNYVDEEAVMKAAREQGFGTAVIGKVGPALMFDHTARSAQTIVVDDATGSPGAIPLSDELKVALTKAGLPLKAPGRGANGHTGTFDTAGTTVANTVQQTYFADVASKVVLPMLKARNKPFMLVFWSRDPDGTQHNQGDSLNKVVPGINGPTSAAGIRNADDDLRQIQDALRDLGLAEDTNIIIAADHGFSTISKESVTSPAAKASYPNVPKGFLPSGFLAVDLATGLGLPLFDPDSNNARVAENAYPKVRGNGLIGNDPAKPEVVIAANGGSDLIYLPGKDPALAKRIVDLLLTQDYVSGLFVDDDLGEIAGSLPLSAIGLKGAAVGPRPSIVVNFRSYSTGCNEPVLCAVTVADTGLQQGQGMHGNFSRADTMNFMAAIGPDFKRAFVDKTPVSNADVGLTMAHLLGLELASKGRLVGRVISEAVVGGSIPEVTRAALRSQPTANGLATVLMTQQVGSTRYFDVAGFPGRTVGLDAGVPTPRGVTP